MRLDAGRRLPGFNLFLPRPGVGAELLFDDDDRSDEAGAVSRVVERLGEEIKTAFGALDLPLSELAVRQHHAGATVALVAPEDALYSAAEALEWACARACGDARDDAELAALKKEREAERNPRLLEVQAEARRRGIPALPCDDHLSLGLGRRSVTYDIRALPDNIDWSAVGRVPVVYVTGTNGKTTTTRLLARMFDAAGETSGFSSTDGLFVGGELSEDGDWSGPGGARGVLRDTRVEAAILETARGGLLRRGLAATDVDAACVTNIADDHLGEWGIFDLEAMAEAKMLVGHAVRPEGAVVLNAADPLLSSHGDAFAAPVTFFALDRAAHPKARWFLDGDTICFDDTAVTNVQDIPVAFGGAARHNIENALCAAALGHAAGLSFADIAEGLRTFRTDADDSPGRNNIVEKDGIRVLLDFAHNPAGVSAALDFVAALRKQRPGGRLTVLIGQAGDRTDADIDSLAKSVVDGGADRVIVRELVKYLRGRNMGEIPELFRQRFVKMGMRDVSVADGDLDGLEQALTGVAPGDFIAFLLLVDRAGVAERLRSLGYAAI